MNAKKAKKYPILSYLCYLLAVCVLFTGVTFSRYTGSTSGNADVELSRFACSYEITDLSATSFINSPYWIENNGSKSSVNTLRTMTYTVRNYKTDGSDEVSEVALENTLRIYGPYEFISKLAWQMVRVDGEASFTTVTPQYAMDDIVSDYLAGKTTFDTSAGEAYDARVSDPELLQLSGDFSAEGTGTLSATCADSGNSFTLTAYNQTSVDYSMSFLRGEKITVSAGGTEAEDHISKAVEPFYIDFNGDMKYCTLDIRLGDMSLPANQRTEKSFMIFFTITQPMENINSDNWDDYLSYTDGAFTPKEADGPVTGYHYDQTVNVYDAGGNPEEAGASVRVRYAFASQQASYFFLDGNGGETRLTKVNDEFYIADGKYYKLSEFTDPLSSGGVSYMLGQCEHKDYALVFKSIFIQGSRTGGND